jgi:hypothetical protein
MSKDSSVCDVCNKNVQRPDGHLLTTTQVVKSPAYWKHYYECHAWEFAVMRIMSFEEFRRNPLMRSTCEKGVARQKTPWIVCAECISMFETDTEKTQSYAKLWWERGGKFAPPGTGPARSADINMGGR